MFRWILLLTLVTVTSASMIFPCPFPLCETLTITNMENSTLEYVPESFYHHVSRRVTFNCYLAPDNIPCDYIPSQLRCSKSGCKSTVPAHTKLQHVQVSGKTTSFGHLSMSERLQQYPELPMSIDRIDDVVINYTLETCMDCPICNHEMWFRYDFRMLLNLFIILISTITNIAHGNFISMGITLLAAVAYGSYHDMISPCSITAPFN